MKAKKAKVIEGPDRLSPLPWRADGETWDQFYTVSDSNQMRVACFITREDANFIAALANQWHKKQKAAKNLPDARQQQQQKEQIC